MRLHLRLAAVVTLFAGCALACSGAVPEEDTGSNGSDLIRSLPPVVIGLPPIAVLPPDASLVVSDRTDTAQILAEADLWFNRWFPDADADVANKIVTIFNYSDPTAFPGYWQLNDRITALVQMYDLVLPLDANRAGVYLDRLHSFASALLDLRDDHRIVPRDHRTGAVTIGTDTAGHPIDPFRGRVMPGWGALTADRNGEWNTDALTSGLFAYALTAFARRVAENPAMQSRTEYDAPSEAIRFITAAVETYEGFRPELQYSFNANDPEAYFKKPAAYANLVCGEYLDGFYVVTNSSCQGYKDEAGRPLAWNENFGMMRALADLALAANSPLFLGSSAADFTSRWYATVEAPIVVAKYITFFKDHLQRIQADDGAPSFYWTPDLDNTGRAQDTNHGNFELGLFMAIYDDKARLDALLAVDARPETVDIEYEDLLRFSNTFLHRIVVVNGGQAWMHAKVDGSDFKDPVDDRGACDGFTAFTRVDPWNWVRCHEAVYQQPISEGIYDLDQTFNVATHAALIRYKKDR